MKIKDLYKSKGIDLESDNIELRVDKHVSKDGTFDYESYVEEQTRVNIKKITFRGPEFWKIRRISKYIKEHIPDVKFGICHGSRIGDEQRDFRKLLNVEVIGTDISSTATQFPNTIQWDFHEVKEEWLNNVCFIFSNSLDHSYDPVKCLRSWRSCIRPEGKKFVQRGPDDRPASQTGVQPHTPAADMFQSTDELFDKIVNVAGEDKWEIIQPDKLIFRGESSKSPKALKSMVVLQRKK